MIKVVYLIQCDNCQDFLGRSFDDSCPEESSIANFLSSANVVGWTRNSNVDTCPTCNVADLIDDEMVCPCCR